MNDEPADRLYMVHGGAELSSNFLSVGVRSHIVNAPGLAHTSAG